ncbi:hypothetical protein [Faecalibaculum rodentium]|uniref:hypothetical protein n=1 Tax=Faecalibaculum rodentium TaxID=1702221 RepID=UPI00272A6DBF|nr:hypothetical protein [Faecalibaculum rodentium]
MKRVLSCFLSAVLMAGCANQSAQHSGGTDNSVETNSSTGGTKAAISQDGGHKLIDYCFDTYKNEDGTYEGYALIQTKSTANHPEAYADYTCEMLDADGNVLVEGTGTLSFTIPNEVFFDDITFSGLNSEPVSLKMEFEKGNTIDNPIPSPKDILSVDNVEFTPSKTNSDDHIGTLAATIKYEQEDSLGPIDLAIWTAFRKDGKLVYVDTDHEYEVPAGKEIIHESTIFQPKGKKIDYDEVEVYVEPIDQYDFDEEYIKENGNESEDAE